jgi:hypothetical protein
MSPHASDSMRNILFSMSAIEFLKPALSTTSFCRCFSRSGSSVSTVMPSSTSLVKNQSGGRAGQRESESSFLRARTTTHGALGVSGGTEASNDQQAKLDALKVAHFRACRPAERARTSALLRHVPRVHNVVQSSARNP